MRKRATSNARSATPIRTSTLLSEGGAMKHTTLIAIAVGSVLGAALPAAYADGEQPVTAPSPENQQQQQAGPSDSSWRQADRGDRANDQGDVSRDQADIRSDRRDIKGDRA